MSAGEQGDATFGAACGHCGLRRQMLIRSWLSSMQLDRIDVLIADGFLPMWAGVLVCVGCDSGLSMPRSDALRSIRRDVGSG